MGEADPPSEPPLLAPSDICDVGGACNALSASPDGTLVVVAGREILKILSAKKGLQVTQNLRQGRAMNTNSSSNDVKWHPLEYCKNLLVTAATNGAVVLWNLNNQQKLERVVTEHSRTVNKVCWHPTESQWFVSGSQDGTIKLWDTRDLTTSKATMQGKTESVRDVQFSPFYSHYFAAGFENGAIQIWDIRKTGVCERQITGHQGLVLSLDWHPEEKSILASAGRDRHIKVWDLNNAARPTHTLQTIASVGHVVWRPFHKRELVSAASLGDYQLHLWDISRPFIPKASFCGHTDALSSAIWEADQNSLLSCSKDGTVRRHTIESAYKPQRDMNTTAISWNFRNQVAVVTDWIDRSETLEPTSLNMGPAVSLWGISGVSADSHAASSTSNTQVGLAAENGIIRMHHADEAKQPAGVIGDSETFSKTAASYKWTGDTQSALCAHNAKVASDASLHHIAHIWNTIPLLLDFPVTGTSTSASTHSPQKKHAPVLPFLVLTELPPSPKLTASETAALLAVPSLAPEDDDGEFELLKDLEAALPMLAQFRAALVPDQGQNAGSAQGAALGHQARGASPAFFEELGEHADLLDDTLDGLMAHTDDTWVSPKLFRSDSSFLPQDAVVPFPELDFSALENPSPLAGPSSASGPPTRNRRGPLSKQPMTPHTPRTPSQVESASSPGTRPLALSATALALAAVVDLPQSQTEQLGFSDTLRDILELLAELGDVQSCTMICAVVGLQNLPPSIPVRRVEQWWLEYVELLYRMRIYPTAAALIRSCPIASVAALSQTSTTMHTNCGGCSKPLIDSGWYCEKCKALAAPCPVCDLPVRGMYSWCQGCGHGGHAAHIQQWFSKNRQCPFPGCAHTCIDS